MFQPLPYLLIPTGFAISDSRWKKYSFAIGYLLYASGVIENGLASMVGVLTTPSSNWLSSHFLSNIVPDIVSGQLDSWWNSYLGPDWIGVAASIVTFALLFPLVCVYFLGKSENELNLSVVQWNQPRKRDYCDKRTNSKGSLTTNRNIAKTQTHNMLRTKASITSASQRTILVEG